MSPRIMLVKYGAHDWSGRMQMGGKPVQLPNCDLKMAESKILMLFGIHSKHLVKSHVNSWSGPMQMGGHMQRKRVLK